MTYAISLNMPLDDETKEHIANALWMLTFEPEKIAEDVVVKLQDAKNSAQSFGTRMNVYLDWLLAHPQSHNPSYKLRYSTLKPLCNELTPHQAYVIVNKFLGLNASRDSVDCPKRPICSFLATTCLS